MIDIINLRLLGFATLLATMIFTQVSADARGSFATEKPWAAEHIDALPADIRHTVTKHERACGGQAAAGHYFSVEIDASGRRFIALHYENFYCPGSRAVCGSTGCLHEVFVETAGRRARVFTINADEVKMTNLGGKAGLEVTRGGIKTALKWNGRQFLQANRGGF